MEKEMQFQFYQGDCASSMRYEDGRKVYTFAKDAILPFRREPNMVDFYDAAPKLMMSTTADWKEKSRWFYGVNEDYGSFTAIPEAQKKVDELIRGKKTELEKVAVLTHWVSDNIRYAAYEPHTTIYHHNLPMIAIIHFTGKSGETDFQERKDFYAFTKHLFIKIMRHFPTAHIVIQHPYLHSVTSPVNQGISNQPTYRIILKNIKLQMDVMTSSVNIFQ